MTCGCTSPSIAVLKLPLLWLSRVGPGVVDTVLSYCHYCLDDTSLESILPYLKEKGVGVINASILSMGLLTEQVGKPVQYHCFRNVHDWELLTHTIIPLDAHDGANRVLPPGILLQRRSSRHARLQLKRHRKLVATYQCWLSRQQSGILLFIPI